MADPKDYVGLSVEELEDYIKKEFKDVLYSYPISVMEARAGIYLDVLEDGSLYLDTLNIFPAAQGQGKGKEILNILKTWADENKLSVYIKPAFLEDNPTFKGIETSAEEQVDNLFNYYKNNGWVDNPNFINLSSEEQAAQLSLSAGRDWGIETNDIYSPLVYTPEGVEVPELPKNPYKDDMISFAEKFNKEGKAFLDGYNQPILDEVLEELLKLEFYFGVEGYIEESEWKKSKLHNVAVELYNNDINPNDIDDISKYIPRNKILTPAEIFKEGKRNEFFTDGIVELLSKSSGNFYKSNDDMDEMFPDNRPKRDYKLYHAISADSEKEIAERVAQYKKDHTSVIQGPPKALNYIKYTSEGEKSIPGLDTPTNVVDERLRLERIIKNEIQTPKLKKGLLKRYLDYDEFIKGLPADMAEQLLDYTNKDVAFNLDLFKDQFDLQKPYYPGEIESINSILFDWEEPAPIQDAVLADIEDWDLDAEGNPIDPRKKPEGMSKFKNELSAQYNYLLTQDTPTNVVDDAPLLETRFKIESIDPDDFGSSENKYDLVTGWEDDVITPNKVFNPDQFTILNEQSIPVFTAKGKEIYQRILSGTATDEDITKFFIYLVTHSPSPAYTFAQFNRPDALADVIKIGIFSDRPLNKILPLGSGLLEKQLFDRLLSRNKNIKQEEIVSIILDIVQENGQFENIRDKMRNVILNAHNDIYNKNPNDYFVLWRGGNLNRTFPWQSMTKRTEAAQDVAQQMNGIYGGGIETSSYVLHKNNFIDLDALGLSHMNEQEVIVFTEAALAKGAKRPTPVNNPDKAKNISEWWLLARESEDMFPKNGVDMTNISQYVDDSGQATQQFFSDVINGIDPRYKPSRPYEPIIEITNDELLSFQKQYNNIVKNGGNFNQHIFTSIPTFYEAQIVKGQALINLLNNAFPTRIFSFEQGLKDGLFDFKLLDIGGTEGSWASTIASLEPRIQVTVLDPNREAKNIFDKNILVNKQFRNAAFTHIKDDFGKYFDETGISFYQEKREYDIVHESMALQFIDADRTGQIEFIKNEVLKPNGILFIEEKFLDNDTIYQANENLKNEFKLQYYTEEQLQNKKFDVLLNMEGKQAAISDVEATLNKNFKHVVQYWDSGNFKGFVASDDEKVLGFVDEINALNTSLTNHRFSTAPTDKEIKYSIQKKITQNGTDPQLAAKIAEETVAQSPQYFNKLSKIAARFGVVGGTALAGLAKLAPALAPGDYAIEKAIEKAVPYLDDAAARLGFARIPFKNLLPTYMAYEIGVAGADIIQAAMYAYDKSQQLPKPSAAAFGSDTFQESLTRLLLPKAYEEEAIKRSQVPGDLLAFYQTPTGKRIVEEMKFGNQFMKELEQEKISKYSPGWGLTKGLLSILGELAQYEAPEVTLNSSDYTTKLKENPAMIYNAGITGSNK